MSKKFSIIKTMDTNKLHYEINNHINNYDEDSPYIFMNIDTLEAIACECIPEIELRTCEKPDGYVAQYESNKVFINNDLKFGEVEIR